MGIAPPPARIEKPSQLNLPPEASQAVEMLAENLSEKDGKQFFQEVMVALVRSQAENDFAPVRQVILTWLNTLIARSHPDYAANAKKARRQIQHPKGDTVEQLRQQFGA